MHPTMLLFSCDNKVQSGVTTLAAVMWMVSETFNNHWVCWHKHTGYSQSWWSRLSSINATKLFSVSTSSLADS